MASLARGSRGVSFPVAGSLACVFRVTCPQASPWLVRWRSVLAEPRRRWALSWFLGPPRPGGLQRGVVRGADFALFRHNRVLRVTKMREPSSLPALPSSAAALISLMPLDHERNERFISSSCPPTPGRKAAGKRGRHLFQESPTFPEIPADCHSHLPSIEGHSSCRKGER